MKKIGKKVFALLLVTAMIFAFISEGAAQAASKKGISLSKSSLTLKVKKSKKITVRNTTGKKVKKVKWTVTKGASVIKLSGKSKSGVTIKGKKKGNAVVKADIAVKGKKVVKKVKVKVVKESSGDKADPTGPAATEPAATKPAAPTVKPTEVPVEELLHYDMSCSADGKRLIDQSGKGNDAELVGVNTELQEDNSLLLEKNAYIKLPEKIFTGQDSFTISIWLKNYSGNINTSAMFVGTKESLPVSYWLLNPANPEGRMKSVMTDSKNPKEPWTTEVGISPSIASKGVKGPLTGTAWNHYVTVITRDSITGYLNGQKVGSSVLTSKFSDFGKDIVAYIGKSSYQDPSWTGFVREVQVYQGAKTEAEVTQMYNDTKGSSISTKGTETEIFIQDRADPFITLGKDGYYYFTASYPMYGFRDAQGYDRIILRRSKTLDGLKTAEEKVVFDEQDSTISHRFIWAPEMHYIGGKWYLFYAASGQANNVWDINCHVLMCKGQDPYNDEWEEKGKFQAADGDTFSFTGFSLDMTYFECNGRSYVIWAQKPVNGTSNLYMAEVDPKEPWKTKTKAMLLTKPEYYWECVSIPVNEGASVVMHDGKVIVAYSASATGPEYCIGFMYADEKADLLDIKSWTKQKTPALTSDDLVDEYGPGHNSFTKDADGNDIFVYHSRDKACFENKCKYGSEDPLYDPCRSARIRKVKWDENGLPILNQ